MGHSVTFSVSVVKNEPSEGRDDYLEAVSPERSLPADEAYSDAEQEEEGDEEEDEEQEEEEDARTEGSAPEEEEEEEDEGEDDEEEMEEGRGVLCESRVRLPFQMDPALTSDSALGGGTEDGSIWV